MQNMRAITTPIEIQDPPLARWLFTSTASAVLWLVLRVFLAWQWFPSGWGKLTNPAWMTTGEALKTSWTNYIRIPEAGRPAITFDWYRSFLQYLLDTGAYVWFAKLIAIGEVLVAIALVIGMFTGIAAFFGGFMNWNFMMAGTASTNPLLFTIAIGIMLAWKVAGYYGVDRDLLPALGTPWQPGPLLTRRPVATTAAADATETATPAVSAPGTA
jgi:thiosulfate dehydrogenase [quinone] large subunit